jgi:hypothetical protein
MHRLGLQNRLHQFNSGRGLHQSHQGLATDRYGTDLGASLSARPRWQASIDRGVCGGANQQAAYQPSGNGSSGQANPLSLAGLGCWLDGDRLLDKKSSCGAGVTASRTASSNRSNSASLIALSTFKRVGSQKTLVERLSGWLKFDQSEDRSMHGCHSVNSGANLNGLGHVQCERNHTFQRFF